jgi:L-lysine 2,3-aminomutase
MVQRCASAARIRAELDKCVPRCARCHRRDTWAKRPSSWRGAAQLPPSWRRRLELQDFNDRLKVALGCADCGWSGWARGLDWDHVRGNKSNSIATLINDRWPVEVLILETAKCDVVCANCHRLRTCERRRTTRVSGADARADHV